MGYYNDVGLVLNKKAAALFKGEILLSPIAHKVIELLKYAEHYKNKEGDEAYRWISIKWYGDQEQDFIETFCRKLEDSEAWLFVRVGEELTDIETEGGYWDNPFGLQIIREVSINASEEERVHED